MNEVLVSKIFNYTSTPTKNVEGQFWFNPSTNVLSRFNGTVWKPITVSSDDVAVLTDGSKVSLTNYLNTQIAALAEGIDSKQDKLKYYSETSGANIKLESSVAEGLFTTASGSFSHAEGIQTNASGNYSHAEGQSTIASGLSSHAEGIQTNASGRYSHAEGSYTRASSDNQHAQGKYNIEDANGKYADIIGNGSSENKRSNAATVSWEGISWSQTDVRAGGTDQDSATHSLSAKQNATDNNLTTIDKTIVGAINELESGKQDVSNLVTTLSSSSTDVQYPSAKAVFTAVNSLVVTSTSSGVLTVTSAEGVNISIETKQCEVTINPDINNIGAVYISTSSTKPTENPIYPDQIMTLKFPNASLVKLYADSIGNKASVTISLYG